LIIKQRFANRSPPGSLAQATGGAVPAQTAAIPIHVPTTYQQHLSMMALLSAGSAPPAAALDY